MEDKIIEILKTHNKAITYEDIFKELTEEEQIKLTQILIKLEDELKIRKTNKGKYEIFHDKTRKVGTFIYNPKGFGFVMVEGEPEDYFIYKTNVNNAINGDKVVIKIIDSVKHEAKIEKIVERDLKDYLVGEFYIKDNKNLINLDDKKLNLIIEIKDPKGAMPGHKVIVKALNNIEGTNYYEGEILKILGHKNDPGVDILSIAAKYNIDEEFSEEIMEELEDIPSEVDEEDKKGRKDLRDKMIFTIDGDDTKDIDDAISVEILENGNYLLGVHIADVSFYVKENSEIGKEAYERGTSYYLADRVIPMLPHKLSNGICSLNPNVDRLAISCEMELDENGKLVTSQIYPSLIKSRKQMTYKNVNKIIEEDIIPEGYEEFADALKLMHKLAHIIRKEKVSRGYIDFEIDEPKIIVDENGKAVDVIKRERGEGEKLIEDFMIIANETVATTINFMNLPFVYRVHDKPDEEKMDNFLNFLGILGYKVNANLNKMYPLTVQSIIKQIEDKKEFPILSTMLLRSMKKAIYDVNNIGHFGLGSKCYTHFTSPIRRLPDLTVHRLLRKYLFDHEINNNTEDLQAKLLQLSIHASERERASVDCEREVDDMKMAEYMLSHIGDIYEGMISTVTKYGFYVELPNLIEGLVKVDTLKGYYYYDEKTFSLTSKDKKTSYRLGTKVKVQVSEVIKERGIIDFIIPEKNGNTKQES